MKHFIFSCLAVFAILVTSAQQKEGTVLYERVSQVTVNFSNMPSGMEQNIPKSRTDKFELHFGNGRSLWKQAEQENDDDVINSGGEGIQMRIMIAGSNDVLYTNLDSLTRVEKREMFDKSFIIDDTVTKLKWKMTGETKTILNMPCMKAVASSIRTRVQTMMNDGKMERKEVTDTVAVVAWFTTNIPVAAGPAEYQGQLPGLILEMDINNGKQVFRALNFTPKADLAVIKAPVGKKHYTPAEFRKERDKMMAEMEKNNQGGRRMIRMN